MGDHKTVGVSNVYVPNEFDVYLGKEDFDHLASFEDSLKTELSNYVTAFARREGWTLVAPPRIELHCDEDLRLGEFGIATRTMGAPVEMPGADAFGSGRGRAAGGRRGARPVIDQTVLYQEPAVPAAAAAPRVSSARGVLRGRQGDYQLTETVTVIGRSRRCDIVLTDPNVSRQHAEIRKQDDGFMLLDLGSTNGTRVNRRDVKQVVLQHGDRIEFGTTEFLFERQP